VNAKQLDDLMDVRVFLELIIDHHYQINPIYVISLDQAVIEELGLFN